MSENLEGLKESMKAELGRETPSIPSSAESSTQDRGGTASVGGSERQGGPSPSAEPPRETRPNLNSVSREDKAAFAFRRQLERQRNDSLAELRKRDDRIAELERKLADFTKPAPKKRADFGTDDEYMEYIAGRKADEALARRDGENAERERKAAEENDRERAEREETERIVSVFRDNVRNGLGEERGARFLTRLQSFAEKGLATILDNDAVARRFFFENEEGPAVLERIMDDPATLRRVFKPTRDPMERLYTLHRIADELGGEAGRRAGSGGLPVIGKPGSGSGKAPSNDMFASSSALSEYIRNRRMRRR